MKIFQVEGYWVEDGDDEVVEVLMTDYEDELPESLDEQIMFQGVLEEELKLSMDKGIPIVDDFVVLSYSSYEENDPTN